MAAFRAWHDLNETAMLVNAGGSPAICAHILSADATNGAVWMGSKLQGAELESVYILQPELLASRQVFHVLDAKRGFCDCLKVTDSTTRGTHNLLAKQVAGLGSPTWLSCPELGYEDCLFDDEEEYRPRSIRLFCYTSDGGPDEEKLNKLLLVLTADHLCVLVVPGTCFMHACQLWVRSGLVIVDTWLKKYLAAESKFKYFATLSKISPVWRDRASEVFQTFSDLIQPAAAVAYAKSLCPKCIAGRWQSSHAVEAKLMGIGPTWFVPVFNEVLKSKSAAGKKRPDPAGPAPLADEGLDRLAETANEHRARMGRWRTDVSKQQTIAFTVSSTSSTQLSTLWTKDS